MHINTLVNSNIIYWMYSNMSYIYQHMRHFNLWARVPTDHYLHQNYTLQKLITTSYLAPHANKILQIARHIHPERCITQVICFLRRPNISSTYGYILRSAYTSIMEPCCAGHACGIYILYTIPIFWDTKQKFEVSVHRVVSSSYCSMFTSTQY